MNNSLPYLDWVEIVKNEYLDNFIKDGGSAIKFAVPLGEDIRPLLFERISGVARDLGYLAVEVDAKETKVHMMHEVFFRIAEQIDWESLSHQVISNFAKELDYNLPQQDDGRPMLERISEESGIDIQLLRSQFNRQLSERVFRHRGLAKDFRVAMVQLCISILSGGPDGANAVQALTDWLTGKNRRISAVKPFMIFNPITRTNARYMFESLLNWIYFVGHTGLVLLMDTSRITVSRNPRDGFFFYTRPSVLDSYEVLRQFIDSVDKLRGCLILVSPDIDFLSEEIKGRGFGAYDALRFRVVDEIRDRQIVNPLSSLVRVSTAETVR